MFVADTNVVSELMKKSPDQNVLAWVNNRPGGELYTTAITVAEVLYGIRRLPHGARRDLLEATARTVFRAFESHILAFDADAATMYAEIVANRERAGSPISAIDAQIGAICSSHAAALLLGMSTTSRASTSRSSTLDILSSSCSAQSRSWS